MKQHALLLVLFVAAAAAACGKSSDVAPVAAEARGLVKSYEPRLAELERRRQDLVRRGEALQLGSDVTGQLDELARDVLPTMQREMREADGKIGRLVADEKQGERQRLDELRKYADSLRRGLATDWLRAATKLDAIESWVYRAEERARMQAQAVMAPATNMPATPPAASPEPPPASGAAAGAAGGTFPAGDPAAGRDDAGNAAR